MRIVVLTIVLVGLAATSGLAQLASFNTMQFYTEAEFQAAIRPYTQALARNANDAAAHQWLGLAYLHVARQFSAGLSPWAGGALAQAIQSLEKAASLRVTTRALLALAEAYVMAGQRERAQAMMDRVRQQAPPVPLK